MTKRKTTRRATTKGRAKTKAKRATPRGVVAVVESSNANRKRAADVCAELGYKVLADTDSSVIVDKLRNDEGIDVLVAGVPGGKTAIQTALSRQTRPTIIATMAPPADTAWDRCDSAGADLFALRPLDSDGMAAVLKAAHRLQIARDRTRALEGAEMLLRERLLRYGESDSVTGFQHFDFFQKYLVTELKRAKRYGYSLATVLVAIDPWEANVEPDTARKLRTRVASAISACVRDIDVPVDFSDDRFLMFLPYTDLAGAERVGRRLAKVVDSYGSVQAGERNIQMSVSVGISALKQGKPVSFAKLMRDANAAVRAAQLKGGGQVVVRK